MKGKQRVNRGKEAKSKEDGGPRDQSRRAVW